MVLWIFGGNMKKVVSVVIIALSVLFVSALSANAQYSRIALVDLRKVLLESEKGKEARKTLRDELDRLKKNLDAREAELLRMKHAAEQESPMTLDEKSEKGKQYRRKLKDYQNLSEDYQAELKTKDEEFTEKILKEIKEVIKSRGAKDKYTLIVAKSRPDDSIILFMDPAIPVIDISEEVIREYNNFTKTQTTSAETGAMQSVPSPVPTDTARTDQTRGLKAKPTISKSKVQATKPHKAPQKKKTPEDVASEGRNSLNKQSKEGPRDVGSSKVLGTLVPEDPTDIDSYRPFFLRRKDPADKADFRPEKRD
jgi:outer membrane protein